MVSERLGVSRVVVFVLVLLSLAVAAVAGAAPAFAEGGEPWWNVVGTTAPTNLQPGDTVKIVVTANNLGDGDAEGSAVPITVSDRLPAGLEAIGITSKVGPFGFHGRGQCSLQTVTCTFGQTLAPYEGVYLEATVRVERDAQSGAINETVAEGGGATRVTNRQPITVSGSSTPFGVEWFEMVPEAVGGVPQTQVGAHPFQLTTTLDITQQLSASGMAETPALAKDLRFDLPPGMIGNPNAVPQCTSAEFNERIEGHSGCPADTAIGVADTTILLPGLTPQPETVPVPLFNLAPQTGEPARFAFTVLEVPVILDTSVRTGGDYGVVVSVSNISQSADFLADQVTFWGSPEDPSHNGERGWACIAGGFWEAGPCEPVSAPHPQPLLTLPTSCATPWTPTITADSWPEPEVLKTDGYSLHDQYGYALGLSGCNRLTFEPSVQLTPDGQEGSSPTGLTVDIHVPQTAGLNPTGDAQATVKNTTVTLPAGVGLNPAAADGLSACSLEQVGLQSPAPITCPESAKVGTVEIKTPLLPDPLVGAAYLATQDANPFGSLVALYIVAEDAKAGVLVKLAGEVKPDPVTGQLVSTFRETPQLPFEDLYLNFFGGSRAPLGTPALCGGYTTTAAIEPWSGTEAIDSSSEFQITSGPNHEPCSDPLPFHPTLQAGSTDIQTGGYTQLTTTMSREDGEQNLQAIQLHFPEGLIGSLSQVQLCGEQQANEGTCGPESEIGETTVSVGLGGNPFSVVGGKVYITGPYKGAPFGLSIVNPAKAGPFDLGKVVVRAKVEVNPITAALTVTTDPSGPYAIPHILDGIPLQIKHVNVLINRSKFVFNPSNCTPTAITAMLSSSEGTSSNISVPFQVTNCATLKFKPKFAVSTPGKTSRTNGTSLAVKLTYPVEEGQANIAKVKVELPKQLPSRLPTLQKACTEAAFNANPESCPATSKVGEAVATTPTISGVFTGPAYFVSHGGAAWPELIVVLKGEDGVTVDLHGETFISKQGVTSSTFKTIPDVPVGSFELKLPAGQYSALTANGANLCGKSLTMPTEFVAQNGDVINQSTRIATTGCPKMKKAGHKRKGKSHGKRRGAASHPRRR